MPHLPACSQYISASTGITYKNVEWNGLIHHERTETGASRYFNWVGGYEV